ncbi:unnamed protein product [Arabidopsis halleri]
MLKTKTSFDGTLQTTFSSELLAFSQANESWFIVVSSPKAQPRHSNCRKMNVKITYNLSSLKLAYIFSQSQS